MATGSFPLTQAGAGFILVAAGGVAVGLAAGWIFGSLLRRLEHELDLEEARLS